MKGNRDVGVNHWAVVNRYREGESLETVAQEEGVSVRNASMRILREGVELRAEDHRRQTALQPFNHPTTDEDAEMHAYWAKTNNHTNSKRGNKNEGRLLT